jgi:trehalose 6-phosphate phosphatase
MAEIPTETDCDAIDVTLQAEPTEQDRAILHPERLRLSSDDIAIFLDIDGTLLDLAPTPLDVMVPDRLQSALANLKANIDGAIAFVSGRPIGEIDRIFSPLKLPAVGGHGAEIRHSPEGPVVRSRTASLSDTLRAEFTEIVRLAPGLLIEDKGYSVAIHFRQAPHIGGKVMEHIATICRNEQCTGLEILPGKLVVEIKPAGYSKGTGLRELMTVSPFQGRTPIFIGDDVTDDAAFAELPNYGGIGFSVGGAMPGAAFNFDGPQDVRRWLERLAEIAETK